MNDPNRQLLVSAAELLGPLLDELVFVGGCATGLLITDPARQAASGRPSMSTRLWRVKSYAEYDSYPEARNLGLAQDSTSNVNCRWRKGGLLLLDVMPTEERILGFSNRWYTPAIATAQWVMSTGSACDWSRRRASWRPSSKRSVGEAAVTSLAVTISRTRSRSSTVAPSSSERSQRRS